MAWLYLFVAGIFEIFFAASLRLSDNFTRLVPTLAFVLFSMLSFFMMSLSLAQIPLGTVYAVWTGIGAVGVSLVGVLLFGDPLEPLRFFFLTTLIASIIGLKLVSN